MSQQAVDYWAKLKKNQTLMPGRFLSGEAASTKNSGSSPDKLLPAAIGETVAITHRL
jgi:hypothetical protein